MNTTVTRLIPITLIVAAAASACAAPTDNDEHATTSTTSAVTYCLPFETSQLYDHASGYKDYWNVADMTGNFDQTIGTQDLADRFVAVAQKYGFSQICNVNGPSNYTHMTYLLNASGNVPAGASYPGESCTGFDPKLLQVVWASDVNGMVLQAGSVRVSNTAADGNTLNEMKSTILARGFTAKCVEGDPQSLFHVEYWKVPAVVSTPLGNITIPDGPAPAAPTLCSSATGCNDVAVASCRIAPAGPAYYVKRGSTAYAKETTPGIARFKWSEWNAGVDSETVSVCARTSGGEACSPERTIYFQHKSCSPIVSGGPGGW